jgi:hypothetical protein
MSKLADAIRRNQRVESAPIGFGAARPAVKPSLLVGSLGPVAAADGARGAGADFVILDSRPRALSDGDVRSLREASVGLALGAWAGPSDSQSVRSVRQAGLDFLVVEAGSTPAAAMLDEDLGYVLALPAKPEEAFLRSLEPFSLEALLLTELPSPLTVGAQIELSRVGVLGRKPVLCRVPSDASSEELQCLRAAGVVALVTTPDGVAALKRTVAELPPRRARRDDRTVLSLPRGQAAATADDEDDE